MKPLSRDERFGALMLASVVLLVIGGAFLLRWCQRVSAPETPAQVTIIWQEQDTTSTSAKKVKAAGKKEKKKRKGEGKNAKKSGAKPTEPARDLLNEPVPTR